MRVADLRALRDKYERMLALRVVHARAKAEPAYEEPDPRRELAALASAFPGALRELDELPLEEIRDRIEALLRAEATGGTHVEAWMEAQTIVHGLARGALAAKRWLGKRRTPTSAHRDAFLAAVESGDLPLEASAWCDDLARVARPPRGRVMDLVYERAAVALGIDASAVPALLRTAGARAGAGRRGSGGRRAPRRRGGR